MAANDLAGARVSWSHPLAGSPAERLQDASVRTLAAGTLPRCPHPGQLSFWYLPAGSLTCGECTGELLEAVDRNQPPLCEPCRRAGLVPLMPN